MYIVIWNDFEGIQHELTFDRLEDAELEAAALEKKYDGVEIRKGLENGLQRVD